MTTKSGETRYYGWTLEGRIAVPVPLLPGEEDPHDEIAVWALDRVIDTWGNGYEVTWNNGDHSAWQTDGLRVTSISYTSHFVGSNPDVRDLPPFYTISFAYDPRPDVRWTRFGGSRIPKNARLKSITTPRGEYTLSYVAGNPTLPSRLAAIGYCAQGKCLKALDFGWSPVSYSWQETPGFAPPLGVPSAKRLKGSQLADLDGDGRPEFVLARNGSSSEVFQRLTWGNTGTGWSIRPAPWQLPTFLTGSDGELTGARFADIDGDGLPDVIQDHVDWKCNVNGCFPCATQPGSACGGAPGEVTHVSPAVWLNRLGPNVPDQQKRWELHREFEGTQGLGDINFFLKDSVADIDGDGLPDIVRLDVVGTGGTLNVLLNTGQGWSRLPQVVLSEGTLGVRAQLQDVNRDGLLDVVGRVYGQYTDGHIESDEEVWINRGVSNPTAPRISFARVVRHVASPGGTGISLEDPPSLGDIDGDGSYDAVSFFPGPNQGIGDFRAGVGLGDGTGIGFSSVSAAPYRSVIAAMSPRPLNSEPIFTADYGFALLDVNADGLADLVRNHMNRPPGALHPNQGGGQLLINTGTTWQDLHGVTQWQVSAGTNPVPTVPDDVSVKDGSAFVDLNGDGRTDLIQESAVPGSPGRAWLNTFEPPVITAFPNQLAFPTTVAYVVITSTGATTGTAPTYTESGTVDSGTRFAMLPLRVVKSVTANTGAGFTTDTYQYSDLRDSAFDYGPQGFKTMTVTEASGMVTKTTFAQAYPYTGLPIQVERSNQGPVTVTKTTHCTMNLPDDTCAQPFFNTAARQRPPRSTFFVRPVEVLDFSYLRTATFPQPAPAFTEARTSFQHDTLGNPIHTNVQVHGLGEDYSTLTLQEFGAPGSDEQKLGKVTLKRVTTQRGVPQGPPITRTTTYEHQRFFGSLALAKMRVEPGADQLNDLHTEVHTVYDYDRFGNVTTKTSCASDFDHCAPGAEGPVELPFRTTRTSFSVADFNAPSGPGLLPSLGYGDGRFPVVTTNALGHREWTAYDPRLGVLLQTTGPNGIHTCTTYDPLGNQTSETSRCGSTQQLTTTVQRHLTPPSCSPQGCGELALARAVLVTRPPVGSPTWAYTDAVGRTIATRTHHFNGGFIETTTSYDSLGRMASESRPHQLGETAFSSVPTYDPLNRVKLLTQDIGSLDGTSAPTTTTTTTTFLGAKIQTDRLVRGAAQTRSETKNAVGKVISAIDHDGAELKYSYDAEGRLTDTLDPAGNAIHVSYDVRGRQSASTDPDLGAWTYRYNGFGELVRQTDAKGLTTTMTYDQLGRLRTKTDATGTAEWTYDTTEGAGIGKLAVVVSAPDPRLNGNCGSPHLPGNRAFRSFKYTAFGDIAEETQCVDSQTFVTSYEYDSFGRQNVVRYPAINGNRLAIEQHYTTLGFLQYVSDQTDGSVLWAATNMNALGHVTRETLKNGVETTMNRSPSTGWLFHVDSVAHADGNRLIQRWDYRYDEAGNLLRRDRSDAVTVATTQETFTYDPLNRLKTSRVVTSDGLNTTETFFYSSLGNITAKGTKTYSYNSGCMAGTRPAGPHAVCSVTGQGAFAYDGNGNMTSGGGRTVTYNPANKATAIVTTAASAEFIYDAAANRIVQLATSGGTTARTVYIGLGATGKSIYERTVRGSTTEHVQFIYAQGAHAGSAFALRTVTQSGSTITTASKYHHFDHLGSVTAMSDERGRVIGGNGANATVMNYDTWGVRRRPDGRPATVTLNQQPGRREFTGHETITGVGLVNMNGRVYDPVLGRFLSADPNVQFVADLQSYNRYSYVLNNPLRYTDPTGYWTFVGGWFDQVINYSIAGVAIAACAGSAGAGCAIGFTLLATAYNLSSTIQSGAGFEQIVSTLAIGTATGLVGAGIGGALTATWTNQLAAEIVGGGISGGLSALMMTPTTQGNLDNLGQNILLGTVTGAATAAATHYLKGQFQASQASVQEARGGDSAEATLNGPREGQEPDRDLWMLVNRDTQDPARCGIDVTCVVVHSPGGRSAEQLEVDAQVRDFATRDTVGFRNARAATVGERTEFGAEIMKSGGKATTTPTRQGSEYGFTADFSKKPAASVHTHVSPKRVVTIGDVVGAETHSTSVYVLTGRGEYLHYDPKTNVLYYLEYMGRVN